MIVYPKEDVHLDRYVPEEIVLSCELSRPNGKVTWFKDGKKLQESENIKLKSEGPYRRLKILRSGVEDSGEYVCDTADDSIFFNLNIKGIKFRFKIQWCEKVFAPFLFLFLLHICHTWMIQIIKQMLILQKDNQSKYKMQFWNYDFIY